jgi:hypothetical protein
MADHAEPTGPSQSVTISALANPTTRPARTRPFRDYRLPSMLSVPDMKGEHQVLRVLIAANCQRDVAKAESLVVRFSNHPKIETRAICDHVTSRLRHTTIAYENKSLEVSGKDNQDERDLKEMFVKTAYHLCEWADLLVLAPIDADTIARMLHGMTGNLLLEVLRSWDVSKKIILVPGMTTLMWENPMTKKQLNKIRKKWNWIRVMAPILWQFDDKLPSQCHVTWDGFSELVEVIKNQAELMTIGHDVDIATAGSADSKRNLKIDTILPPEIWSLIFQHVGDWETAMALGVYTNLPRPKDWVPSHSLEKSEFYAYMHDLEWMILTRPVSDVIGKLSTAPSTMTHLSSLCVKLIIKFCLTDLLNYLESNFKDVFWTSFGGKLLPTKASAAYGRTEVLEWWRTSPSFLKKDYSIEAVDGASKSGFVHVLDWWRKSGLTMKYSEAALEQASSKGHLLVLEWWKQASMHQGYFNIESDNSKYGNTSLRYRQNSADPIDLETLSASGTTSFDNVVTPAESSPLRLKVGKSIIAAAQNGQAATIRWWDTSGIPYSHSEAVAKIASAYGHVNVLEAWKELKGEKFAMSFDNQVLVGPTKNGFVQVLEWWKGQTVEMHEGQGREGVTSARLRVEYKTCDIEEALEDSVGNSDKVKTWWARNGLNLGVGTSEWMKVKVL